MSYGGQIVMDASSRVPRWKEYVENLLNTTIPDNPIPFTIFQVVGPSSRALSNRK